MTDKEMLDEGMKDKWIMLKARARNFISDIRKESDSGFDKWIAKQNLSKEMAKKISRNIFFKNTQALIDEFAEMMNNKPSKYVDEKGMKKIIDYTKKYLTELYQKHQDRFEKRKNQIIKNIWLEGEHGKIKKEAVLDKISYKIDEALNKAANLAKEEGDKFKQFIVKDVILRKSANKFIKDIDTTKPVKKSGITSKDILNQMLSPDKQNLSQLP